MRDRKLLGKTGEDLACAKLFSEGYRILDRNFRSYRGEVDIVCAGRDEIVFVEVKTRTSDDFGQPEESVNNIKRKRMKETAAYYMAANRKMIEKSVSADPNITFKIIEIMIRETDDSMVF